MLKFGDKDYTWFLLALTLIFAAAKVFGFSNLSWMFVFSPIWIIGAVVLGVYLFYFMFMLIAIIVYGIFIGVKKVFKHDSY